MSCHRTVWSNTEESAAFFNAGKRCFNGYSSRFGKWRTAFISISIVFRVLQVH
jgi:hypothetical protein